MTPSDGSVSKPEKTEPLAYSVQRQASFTAQIVAAARAIETIRPAASRRFTDPYAKSFLLHPVARAAFGTARVFAAPDFAFRLVDRASGVPGLMTSFCCRTRYIDDALHAGLNAGCEQVLILGAGYDCRAYRTYGIERARVFDVDHIATQEFKRTRLHRSIDPNRPNVFYVPVDFEQDDLSERLVAAGFRRDAQSFVIWEGVSQYISPESVSGVLEGISKACARGSLMAFTYIHRGVLDGSGEFPEGRKLAKRAADNGEPWLFGIRPEHVGEFFLTRGLELLEDFGSTQLTAKYLDPIRRFGPLPEFTHVAIARISRSDAGPSQT